MGSTKAEPRTDARWRVCAFLTLTIMTGLLAVDCANPPPNAISARTAPQLCASGATQPSNRFALVHGCITYNDGSAIWAVDPNHPTNKISLGPSNGVMSTEWSRDGSRLLLLEHPDAGSTSDLSVMNADGSRTWLAGDPLSDEGSFSPDSSKVVLARPDDGLYVVDATGGIPQVIARSYLAWWLGSPAWSPDGSRIAYRVYLEGSLDGDTVQIWTVNPDGTHPRLLVNLGECRAACAEGLAWSPDGSMLAFHSIRGVPAGTRAIYTVRADGSGLRRINRNGLQPSWSPDGSRLAFVRFPTPGGIPGEITHGELLTMASDGSDVIPVLEDVALSPNGLAWNPVG